MACSPTPRQMLQSELTITTPPPVSHPFSVSSASSSSSSPCSSPCASSVLETSFLFVFFFFLFFLIPFSFHLFSPVFLLQQLKFILPQIITICGAEFIFFGTFFSVISLFSFYFLLILLPLLLLFRNIYRYTPNLLHNADCGGGDCGCDHDYPCSLQGVLR